MKLRNLTQQHAFARLDVARGLAALAVFAAHISSVLFLRVIGPDHPAAVFFSVVSRHAVLVFFMLSGNLITRSIIFNIRRNGQFEFAEYLAARLARVYPPFLGAVGICIAVWLVTYGLGLPGAVPYGMSGDLFRVREFYSFRPAEILQSILMRGGLLNVNGPLWSLFIECQIYIAVMAVAAFSRRDLLSRAVTLLLALLAFGYLRDQMFFVVIWCLGAACWLWSLGRRINWIAAFTALILLVVAAVQRPELFGSQADTLLGMIVQILCCVCYAMILFFLPLGIHYPRFLVSAGNFSYSLYVIHFPLLMLVLSLSQNWIGQSLTRTCIVAMVAIIAIITFVIPFARLTEQQAAFKKILLTKNLRVPKMRIFYDRL